MTTPVALFDLDGTLCSGHIWEGLSRYFKEHGLNRRLYYSFMATHMAMWLASRLRLLEKRRFVRAWGRDMAVLLRGLEVAEGEQALQAVLREEVLPTLRSDVVEQLRWHQREGYIVTLASGAFQPLLDGVVAALGLEHAVGSSLEVRGNRYTGRLAGQFCFGERKAQRVLEYVALQGLAVDWKASYAYGDRIYDLPLLELVGHPVAVYPDAGLRAVAGERGWPVLEGKSSGLPTEKVSG